MKSPDSQRGFTLIELMFVIAIIGLLAAIGIPSFSRYLRAASSTEIFIVSASVRSSIEEFYSHTGRFPVDNAEAGVPPPEEIFGEGVKGVAVENGAIHVEFDGEVISFRPSIVDSYPNGDLIVWRCGHTETVPGMITFGTDRTTPESDNLPAGCGRFPGTAPGVYR